MSFGEWYCETTDQEAVDGDLEGTCCLCGEDTNYGYFVKFGIDFQGRDFFFDGNVICPCCQVVVNDGDKLRRTMFLQTETKFKTFSEDELKNVVFNLPDKPFYIYLTRTWQDCGWVRLNEGLNGDNQGEVTFVVDYDLINVSLSDLRKYSDFIGHLRNFNISRNMLKHGQLGLFQFRQLVESVGRREARRIQKQLKLYAKDPGFNLAVFIEGVGVK